MIAVQLNKRDFEYDIHSLIRAFYPGMDVPVYQEADHIRKDGRKNWMVVISRIRSHWCFRTVTDRYWRRESSR